MLEPIVWRAVALHPSAIPVSDLIRELAGGEDDLDHVRRREEVLRAAGDAVRVGLLVVVEDSVVATEEAMFVNQFIDNRYAPPLEGEIAECPGHHPQDRGGTGSRSLGGPQAVHLIQAAVENPYPNPATPL